MKSIDAETTAAFLTEFLKTTFAREGFDDAVIALSGGVDSGTSAALAVRALGADHVYPVLLPYGSLNSQGTEDGWSIIDWLGIPKAHVLEIDIQPLVDPILSTDTAMEPVRGGNIMARVRMIVLFDQAKKNKMLVVGTENKSEHLLGYFTRFGDEASDVEPLRHLYKTHVYQLAKHLGLPEQILAKPPSAGLWHNQTDEGEFGFSYTDADEILSLVIDQKRGIDEIVKTGFDRATVEKVIARMKKNDFKHRLPYVPEEA